MNFSAFQVRKSYPVRNQNITFIQVIRLLTMCIKS